jgi:tetratricopeptide (TPR) repeat protein
VLSCQGSRPIAHGRTRLRRHYVLAGVGVALIVAAGVVVVGISSAGGDAAGTVAARSPSGQSLPAGHPSVSAKGGGSTPAPVTNDAVKQKIAELQSASAAQPDDVAVLLELGDAYFLAQRYQQAASTFRAALRIDPGNATATVRLAMVWHADGESQRAEQAIKGVLDKSPGNQEAHYSMAIIYFSSGRIDAARSEWVAAAKLDPSSAIGRRSQSFVDLLDGKQTTEPASGE